MKFKQINVGPWLGMLKDLGSRTMVYVSLINFIMLAVTSWGTPNAQAWLITTLPWVESFLSYIVTLAILVSLLMLMEYFLVIPSHYTFLNKQEYSHENLIKGRIDEMEDSTIKRFNKIYRHLGLPEEVNLRKKK